MKFLIKVNTSKEHTFKVTSDITHLLESENHQYFICSEEGFHFKEFSDKAVDVNEGIKWCDAVITVGGDGTLLAIGKLAADNNKPVIGVNTGRIGFLTAIEGSETELLKKLNDKSVFTVSRHHFIQARVNKSPWKYCLNDVVISKSNYSNTVDLSVYSNDNMLMHFAGDGIILATSTGSTAYSLSVGGPVVDTDLQAMIISPVAPHTLNRTSMVLAKDKHIKIITDDRYNNFATIAFDGRDYRDICRDDVVEVRLSTKYVSIYTLCSQRQFEKVDKKLKSR